jgi:hypothetical protein
MSNLGKAIKALRPTAEFSYSNDDYSTVKWDVLDGTPPTQAEIDSAMELIKTDEANAETNRQAAKSALLEKLGLTDEEAKLLLS